MLHCFAYFYYDMCVFENNVANISCLRFWFTILLYYCVMLWDEYDLAVLDL